MKDGPLFLLSIFGIDLLIKNAEVRGCPFSLKPTTVCPVSSVRFCCAQSLTGHFSEQ